MAPFRPQMAGERGLQWDGPFRYRIGPAAPSMAAISGCGCSSGVEHDLAKVGVEGSNPFARSNFSASQDVARRGARDAERLELCARGGDRTVDVDAAAGILDHDRLEALALGVLGRIAHTEIVSQAGQEHARKAALAQISGKPG